MFPMGGVGGLGGLAGSLTQYNQNAVGIAGKNTGPAAYGGSEIAKKDPSGYDSVDISQRYTLRQTASDYSDVKEQMADGVETLRAAANGLASMLDYAKEMSYLLDEFENNTDADDRETMRNELDVMFVDINVAADIASGVGGNMIGDIRRGDWIVDDVEFKTTPTSGTTSIEGEYLANDYYIETADGDRYYMNAGGSYFERYDTDDNGGEDLNNVAEEVYLSSDMTFTGDTSDGGSITIEEGGTEILSGTLHKKGLGMLHSFFYNRLETDTDIANMRADLDSAIEKLSIAQSEFDTQATIAESRMSFAENLIEDFNKEATRLDVVAAQQDAAQRDSEMIARMREAMANEQFASQAQGMLSSNGGDVVNSLFGGGFKALDYSNLFSSLAIPATAPPAGGPMVEGAEGG